MNDLVIWLREQIDEDERAVETLRTGKWWVDEGSDGVYDAVNHFTDPARVLAEVAAKRKLLDEYEAAGRDPDTDPEVLGFAAGLDVAVLILAEAFADRPGFREEWRP